MKPQKRIEYAKTVLLPAYFDLDTLRSELEEIIRTTSRGRDRAVIKGILRDIEGSLKLFRDGLDRLETEKSHKIKDDTLVTVYFDGKKISK